MKLIFKQTLTVLSCTAMLLAMPVMPAHAANIGDTTVVGGLCGHHTEHTAECMATTSCSHVHTQDCYSDVITCVHVHSDACYASNGAYKCAHVCSAANGCITSQLACCHEHNEDCCYAEGSTCSYSCDSCHAIRQRAARSESNRTAARGGGHHGSHHSGRHHR